VIVALGGLVSSLIGGVISDRLANPPVKKDGSADRPRARAWVPAIGNTHTHTHTHTHYCAANPCTPCYKANPYYDFILHLVHVGATLFALYITVLNISMSH
jgi:hypothetical protein